MKLPELPIKIPKRENQIYKLQGLDRSDEALEGTLWDSKKITSKRLPFFTTSNDESRYGTYSNVTDIAAWDSLLFIDDGKLYYRGVEIPDADLNSEPKKITVINTKIIIFPDKKYIDFDPSLSSPRIVDMVNDISLPPEGGTVSVSTAEPATGATTQTMTITNGWSAYHEQFEKYEELDYIHIKLTKTNVTKEYNLFLAESDGTQSSVYQSGNDLVVKFRTSNAEKFVTDTYTAVETKRVIPDLDFICSKDNCLWGCSSKEQTIFVSEYGKPNHFYTLQDAAYASWAVYVETPDEFTGCAALGSSVVFYKEYCMHKILGNDPNSYAPYTYDVDGVQKGSWRSVQVINDNVYYLSNRGVMAYTGGQTIKISETLGNIALSDGVAGNDGEKYYLSCHENYNGENRSSLFSYDIKTGIWLRDDDTYVKGFAKLGGTLYMIKDEDNGSYIMYNNGLPIDDDWYIQFNDMYESNYNNYGRRTGTVLNKKMYSKLILRVEMPSSSYAIVKIRCDGGRWEDVGHIVGRSGVFTQAVPINRCDKFGIRIEGKGEFTLLAMAREYLGESVRNE